MAQLKLSAPLAKIGGSVESVSVSGAVDGNTFEVIHDLGSVPEGARCLLLLEGEITNSNRFSRPYLRLAGEESPDVPTGITPNFQTLQVVDGPVDLTVELKASGSSHTATLDVTIYFVFFKGDGA